jgi:hypothetical protein
MLASGATIFGYNLDGFMETKTRDGKKIVKQEKLKLG